MPMTIFTGKVSSAFRQIGRNLNIPRVVLGWILILLVSACDQSTDNGGAANGAQSDAMAAAPRGAQTFNLQVVVNGLRSDAGTLQAVLCSPTEKYPNSCSIHLTGQPKNRSTTLTFKDISGGTYAFAVFHDENDDDKIAVSSVGFPLEGLGFSNDAISPAGPPSFGAASFDLAGDGKIIITIRYWN
jgi:uncharacterized protein (DUF2141 family)